MRLIGCLVVFLLLLGIGAGLTEKGQAQSDLQYAPASAANPLKGFVPYAQKGGDFPHSMEWFYIPLKDLQQAENRFTWDLLDAQLNAIAGRGHQAVFRVYLDYPDTEYGVPAFLAAVTKHAYTGNGNGVHHTSYSPDYDDPALRRALTHFIAAFGKRYDGDPRIGFVTLGLLGYWGEWHTYPHDWFPSLTVQNEVLNAYEKAFHRTKLLMREPKPGTNAAGRALGYHDDSFAYQTLPPPGWHFWGKVQALGVTEKWKTEAIGGEVRPEVQGCLWEEAPCTPAGQEFGKCVQTTHVSWLINQGAFTGLSGARFGRAVAGVQRMGYEFFVSQAQMTSTKRSGVLQAALRIRNTGVAPFYYDWKVRVGIVSADRKLVQAWDTDWKVTHLLPGEPDRVWNWKRSVAGLKAGRYTLLVQCVNPLPGGHPVRFANATQDRDLSGWLSVGAFNVGAAK